MGRRKDVQPAKSSAMAAAVHRRGGASSAAIGFGAGHAFGADSGFGAGGVTTSSDPATAEMQQHLKRLSKKNPTTILKALSDLNCLIDDSSEDTITRTIIVLPQWCRVYSRLANDNMVQVRATAHHLMGKIALVVKGELEPHIPSVLARWWMAQFDPRTEASQAANQSLRSAFPGRRINKALRVCRKRLFMEFQEVFSSSPQTVVDPKFVDSLDVAKEMFERQVYCAFAGLGGFVDRLAEVRKFDEKVQAEVAELLAAVWKLGSSKYSQIRLGFYSLIPTLCRHALPVVQLHLDKFAPLVFGALDDGIADNYSAIWAAILHLSKHAPAAWNHVDAERWILPRGLACLRAGAYGSGSATYPAVLPWLSVLPRHLLTPEFAAELCTALWQPIRLRAVPSDTCQKVANAWVECAAHLISEGPASLDAKAQSYARTSKLFSEARDGWLALPNPSKPTGKPTASEIAALKQAKQAKADFLSSLISNLGGKWTPKAVERELNQQAEGLEPASETGPKFQTDTPHDGCSPPDYGAICLREPVVSQLCHGQPANQKRLVAKSIAGAVATQLGTRPRLQPADVDALCDAVVEVALQNMRADSPDGDPCLQWFVDFVKSFDSGCRLVSVEPVAAFRSAQTVADSILKGCTGVPALGHLRLLASLTSHPLSFGHAVAGNVKLFMCERLLPWVLQTAANETMRCYAIDILNSFLASQETEAAARKEWDDCIQSIMGSPHNATVILALVRAATKDEIQGGVPSGVTHLESIGLSDQFYQRVLHDESAAATELLKLGITNNGCPFFSIHSAVKIMHWLTHTLHEYSSSTRAQIENLCSLAGGALSAEYGFAVTDDFYLARSNLLVQIFVLQVECSASAGGGHDGVAPLQTSAYCAQLCDQLWTEHKTLLLDDGTGPSLVQWTDVAPRLAERLLDMLLCQEPGDIIEPSGSVTLASELLTMCTCVSHACLQGILDIILARVVQHLATFSTCSELLRPQVLQFTVGVARIVGPIELFLGTSAEIRRHLLLELFVKADVTMLLATSRCAAGDDSDARALVDGELRSFWSMCCAGELSVDSAEKVTDAHNDGYTFVLQCAHMAVDFLAASDQDSRFDRIFETLFQKHTEASVIATKMPGSAAISNVKLVEDLDETVLRPALALVCSTGSDIDRLQAAVCTANGLLPSLPREHAWRTAMQCCTWVMAHQSFDGVMTQLGAALAVSGKALLLSVERCQTGASDSELHDDIRSLSKQAIMHVSNAAIIGETPQLDDALSLWTLGIMYVARAVAMAGVLSARHEDCVPMWEFCVRQAVSTASSPAGVSQRWRTQVHCESVTLMAALIAELSNAHLDTTQEAAFEDLLSGVAYSQLVDVDEQQPPAVWNALATVLPNWKRPERTILLEYADELAEQLAHPQHSVRVEVYKLLGRLVDTALSDVTDSEDVAGTETDMHGGDPGRERTLATRPALLPGALWDIVEGNPKPASQTADTAPWAEAKITGYLLGWAIVLQTLAHAPSAFKEKIVDYIHRTGAATRLLATLVQLLPFDMTRCSPKPGRTSTMLGFPPLGLWRESSDVGAASVAIFGHTLQQVCTQ
jgi:hypothetical protein